MHYLDIVLGEEYVYEAQLVRVEGTRVTIHAGRGEEEFAVTIRGRDGCAKEVKPHELSPVPQDVRTWNATVERPIGFRRLPT